MTPEEILNEQLARAETTLQQAVIQDPEIVNSVNYVCRCISNRAGVRLLMSCLLAKIHKPQVDPRKPYTELGTNDSFSGRHYDEAFLTHFINENQLPCNVTTAFLTPALRNIDRPLTPEVHLVGRPREVYDNTLLLLQDVYEGKVSAEDLFTETIRILLLVREEKRQRLQDLLKELKHGEGGLPLSSEAIVTLIEQHLACKNSSRLPVLIVAAAYKTANDRLGEYTKPLQSHTAADFQTGAVGDVEVCLVGDNDVVTAYEMKQNKPVTIDDIDAALQKIADVEPKIDNYIFITTDEIDPKVAEYASTFYEETGGIEIAILDCIGFIRHYLHFFHRLRMDFLNAYQKLLLAEPDSAVSQPLKEAFLALRKAAEADE